ncbi:MAG: hypothetical protein M3068_11695 [Gemmatimonadota bacterium]|nr:hypothetical protein [Gemmatimonadota bacterium]
MTKTSANRDGPAMGFNKVPAVTLVFWIIKILATTVGETAADVLSTTFRLGLVVTSWVMAAAFVAALIVQTRVTRYIPAVYWITVVFISVVGTFISDNIVDNFGVGLATTTTIFSVSLAVVFVAWYLSERTLSVHTIVTHKRELFYWAAILFTFSLGASAGDLLTQSHHDVGLGFARLPVTVVILILAAAQRASTEAAAVRVARRSLDGARDPLPRATAPSPLGYRRIA